MKKTFIRPDGTTETIEGTAEELVAYEKALKKEEFNEDKQKVNKRVLNEEISKEIYKEIDERFAQHEREHNHDPIYVPIYPQPIYPQPVYPYLKPYYPFWYGTNDEWTMTRILSSDNTNVLDDGHTLKV